MRKLRQKFTLIEMLVVIAIIIVLAGLVLPAMGVVSGSGQLRTCSSNLRGLFTGSSMYSNNYKDLLVPAKMQGFYWVYYIAMYADIPKQAGNEPFTLARCPTDAKDLTISGAAEDAFYTPVSFARNKYLGDFEGPNNTSMGTPLYTRGMIRQPTKLPVFADGHGGPAFGSVVISNDYYPNASSVNNLTSAAGTKSYSASSPPSFSFIDERHGDGLNFAFFDGHTETLRQPGKQGNDDNEYLLRHFSKASGEDGGYGTGSDLGNMLNPANH